MSDEDTFSDETAHYQLWHTETGNLIAEFAKPTDALKFLLDQDEALVADMALERVTSAGESTIVAQGAELWALAKSERGAPPRHRIMIISEPVRGRDAESIAVDLLKRVFLQGQLQLISIEVLRELEESGDDWDNAFTGTLEQSGDLWMQAVERFRAENKAEAEVHGTAPTIEEELTSLVEIADAALRREYGPTVIGAQPDIDDFLLRAHELLHRPGDYLTAWEQEWATVPTMRQLWPDLAERIARRRAEIQARRSRPRREGLRRIGKLSKDLDLYDDKEP